jgi:hypothetical protein
MLPNNVGFNIPRTRERMAGLLAMLPNIVMYA